MKTEVYSWRLSPRLKMDLEEAAQAERKSVAELLVQISEDWLRRSSGASGSEDERQRQLRDAAMKSIGTLQGNNPDRAENARSEIRSRIARRHGR
jgi:hypothetical protein